MLSYKILELKENINNQEITICPTLIYNENEFILCDVGFPNQLSLIEKELKKLNIGISNLTKVIITHHDHDHVGSLSKLKEKNPKVEIIASKIETIYIEGHKESLRLTQAKAYNQSLVGDELKAGIQFEDYLKSIENCKVDRIVQDNEYIIEGLKVIMSEGHTEGHISLFLEDERILIAGDLLVVENNELAIPFPQFAFNLELTKKSIKKIENISLNKIICYHGGMFKNNIKNELHKIIEL